MPAPPVPPGRGEKPSSGSATISKAFAASAGPGGGDGTSVRPSWFWGGGHGMSRKWGGHEHHPYLPGVTKSRPPAPQHFPKSPLPRPGVGEMKARPCAPRGFGKRARNATKVGRARTSPMPPRCDEKPSPGPATIWAWGRGRRIRTLMTHLGRGCRGCDGTLGGSRQLPGVKKRPSAAHVTSPLASGDSVLSGQGIADAEDGRWDADEGEGGSRGRREWAKMTRQRWWLTVAVTA